MSNKFWDSCTKMIFSYGATVNKVNGKWACSTGSLNLANENPQVLIKRYGLKPIYYVIEIAPLTRQDYIFPEKGENLDRRLQDVCYKKDWDRSHYPTHLKIYNVEYCFGLMLHHLKRMAITYSETLEFGYHHHLNKLKMTKEMQLGRHFQAYYNFDDLISALIRSLDSLRVLIWHGFKESGSVPSSFEKTINASNKMPSELKQILLGKNATYFATAKDFRNCIQHYFSPGIRCVTHFINIDKCFWVFYAFLPDNPESKAALKFTFKNKYDVLSYSHKLVNQAIETLEIISNYVSN